MKKLDLVVLGNTSIDTIKLEGNGNYKVPGGSAAAVGTASRAYNSKVGIITKLGRDFPKKWKEDLLSRGIDSNGLLKQKSSCRFELTYDKKGNLNNFNEIFNVEDVLSVNDVPTSYKKAKYFHLSAAHPKNQERFLTAKSIKSKLSLALWPSYESEYNEKFVKLLKRLEILFCNNHEAKIITGEENIYDAVKKLGKNIKTIVLTKGKKGAAIYNKDKFSIFPALRTSTLDSTGCGDSFAGGFLAEYIKNKDVEKAGWAGVAMASFTLSKIGSWFPKNIKLEEINKRVERAKKYSEKNIKKGTLLDFF